MSLNLTLSSILPCSPCLPMAAALLPTPVVLFLYFFCILYPDWLQLSSLLSSGSALLPVSPSVSVSDSGVRRFCQTASALTNGKKETLNTPIILHSC